MGKLAPRSRTFRAAAVVAISLAAVLTGCGGDGATKASASSPTSSASASGRSPGGGAVPGASGSVAAISGSSMEVQNPSAGQTTVNWTGSTTFDQTVTLTASSLAAGECVTVTGTTSKGTITARSVAITAAASSGTCAAGPGAGGRGRFPGGTRNGNHPRGSVPNGPNPGRSMANIGFAGGKIVSSSPTELVIYGTSFTGFGSTTARSTPPTTAAPADVTVNLTPSTTFTEVRPAAAGDLAVGDCVVADGPADATGAVTAKTVRITSTGGKSCTTGFGRFGGGPSGSAPAGSTSADD